MFFHGVIPAILTPFRDDGRIHEDALRAQVTRLVDAGVDGIVTTGTMGEFRSLSEAERSAVIGTALETVAGRVPVTVGVSSDSAEHSSSIARAAARAGASSLMCLPPLSYRADLGELVAFFSQVAQATDLPLMIYNNPSGSGTDLDPATLARLARIENVAAVKETSGDARRVAAVLEATDGRVEVLVGGDDCALEGLAAGAAGWITGCGVVAPREAIELFAAVTDGDLPKARAVYRRLLPLARLDMDPKLVQYFKGALDRIGEYGGPSRPPRLPLIDAEWQLLDAALAALAPATVSG